MSDRRDVLERIRQQAPAPGFGELLDRRDRRARRARVSAIGTALVVTVLALGGAFLALRSLGADGLSLGDGQQGSAFPQNGAISFTVREDNAWHVGTVNPDGSDRTILTHGERDYGTSWSPDGSQIAYDTELHGSIWVMNADGSGQHQLTAGNDVFPHWSPDGTQIAFSRYGTGESGNDRQAMYPGLHVWTINADGTGARQVTDGAFVDTSGSWSPDGSMISFLRVGTEGGEAGIWVVNADGSEAREVTAIGAQIDGHPSWSPDGTRIVYARESFVAGNYAPQVWVVNVDGSGDHLLLEGAADPMWSPDGTQIVYSDGDIWVMDADGTHRQQVTDTPEEEIVPSWGARAGS
jgi:TolB protein